MNKTILPRLLAGAVAIVLLLAMLTACAPFGLRQRGAAALRELYGEEFRVVAVGGDSLNGVPTSFFNAVATRADDDTLRFEVTFNREGKVVYDNYAEALYAREVRDAFAPIAAEIAGSYALFVLVQQFDKERADINPDFSYQYEGNARQAIIELVIDESTSRMDFSQEYARFVQFFEQEYGQELPINAMLSIVSADETTVQNSQQYFDTHPKLEGGYHKTVQDLKTAYIFMRTGTVDTTEEKYVETRTNGSGPSITHYG